MTSTQLDVGPLRLAVISDTHNLLRPEMLRQVEGCDGILHAGDVCRKDVLSALQQRAPVWVARGNNDHGVWAEALPELLRVRLGGLNIGIVHALESVQGSVEALDVALLIVGHSHSPSVTRQGGSVILNPGSAGPTRFRLPIAMALVTIQAGQFDVEPLRLG